ncbi:diguanylate cyclase [Amycolatopsis sp. NPDC059657]|uniref:GGDEF domain-containing protein n=1 Tax=Amycolatopsis sp. NPDC059657 TaxID=3346899 RepID=UPI003672ABDF
MARWRLWSLPRPALRLLITVEALAVVIVALSAAHTSVTRAAIGWFAVLAGGALVHLEVARGIERRRERAVEGAPYTNMKSLWVFAGLLLVPLPLVAALAVITFAHAWFRVYGPAIAHRKVYGAATFVLASAAAEAVLRAGGLTSLPRLPSGLWPLVIIVAAAAVWWLVNLALVVGVILLASPRTTARQALGNLADQLVVAAALGLGITIAVLLAVMPWAALVPMVAVICVHRDLLLPQYQRQARTDAKTGLATSVYWAEEVASLIRRAGITNTALSVLILDLNDFKTINDTHGHIAGDEALLATVTTVRAEVRSEDLVARYGGDELVILMPGIGSDDLPGAVKRLRARIAHTPVTLTCSSQSPDTVITVTAAIGGASYPHDGHTHDQLLFAADKRLYIDKHHRRDQADKALEA